MEFKLLRRQVRLIKRIDEFFNYLSESGITFKLGVAAYLRGDMDTFNDKLKAIGRSEHLGDELRREIERDMYTKTLIPESRGDVLELLENLDALLDRFKAVMWQFDIQQPAVPEPLHEDANNLCAYVVEAVEAIVLSSRAFFTDLNQVANTLHKVSAWESEADYVNTRLQKKIYRMPGVELAFRNQLRDFARRIDNIADAAEDVADRLSIYVIKRSL
ncbi:DUF47 domain-containing protein [Pseudodesulfovibrio tunisiensis]|uniref:DUF47 domain-containing protein n=1 Tax=Pseudodesulfovibrio tunisiensis TaxID=463192 RepID=UPI001FB2ED5E|nr:DUF47 family protein [Pseudodesulfovibrio tunisiensis]